MKFSIRFADKIVGALVILALAILVVVIFMLGRSQRWFKYDYQYISYFEAATGLSKNMAVQYKGFTIGHVKDFHLADDDRVEVVFTVFEEYRDRWVKEGSVVEVVASPIGLGNSFLFHPGRGVKILDEGSLVPDHNSQEGKFLIASGMATKVESADSINNLLNNVNGILETINISLSGSEGAEDLALGQILLSLQPTLNNLEEITSGIDDIIKGLNGPNSALMLALDGDGPVYNELVGAIISISNIIEDTSHIIGDVSKTTHVLPSTLPVLLSDITIILRQVQDVLTSVANNPLLKGGIPERAETGPGGANTRNLDF